MLNLSSVLDVRERHSTAKVRQHHTPLSVLPALAREEDVLGLEIKMGDGVPIWIGPVSLNVLDAGVQLGKRFGDAVQDMPNPSFVEVSGPGLEFCDSFV